VLIVVAIGLAASGCASDVVKDYGDQAKLNFVGACTAERSVKDGTVTVTSLAPKSTCTCIYNYIASPKHQLDFGDLTTYEAKVTDASPGSLPKPPAKLTKAISVCTPVSGPTPTTKPKSSSSTTTTAG
jgi:hypothetical protein